MRPVCRLLISGEVQWYSCTLGRPGSRPCRGRVFRSGTTPRSSRPLRGDRGAVVDSLYDYRLLDRGPRIVAIGGGTGMPGLLRGLTASTSNITAIVTVADDGGSSGRLRKELGLLPPGDFRNNLAALARDEALMTQVLQYRFGVSPPWSWTICLTMARPRPVPPCSRLRASSTR